MRIYRVEHKFDNLGPFRSTNFNIQFDNRTTSDHDFLSPEQEGLNHAIRRGFGGFVIGCTSLEEFLRWFKPFLQYLHNEEYVLRIFKSHNYYVGKSGGQVAFNRDCYSTRILEEISLQSLIK